MLSKKIQNSELQEHIHHVDLENFLKQLVEVFNQASQDTEGMEGMKATSQQYHHSAMSMEDLRLELFNGK